MTSGIFISLDGAPEWLIVLGDILPLKHFSETIQSRFQPFHTGPSE